MPSLTASARGAASGEASAPGDIAQLKSLCDVMDNEAFLPVRLEELTNPEVPRRLIGLANLISDLTAKAVAKGIANTTRVKERHGWRSAGRYLWIGAGPADASLAGA
jgi:hypothetical protein